MTEAVRSPRAGRRQWDSGVSAGTGLVLSTRRSCRGRRWEGKDAPARVQVPDAGGCPGTGLGCSEPQPENVTGAMEAPQTSDLGEKCVSSSGIGGACALS